MTTTRHDQDIDLDLDDPKPIATPDIVSRSALIAGGLVLIGAGIASFTGDLTLESKAFPLLLALLLILGVVGTLRRPTSH